MTQRESGFERIDDYNNLNSMIDRFETQARVNLLNNQCFSFRRRNDDIESFRSKRYRYPDNKTPPLITLSIRGKMRHNFSQFPRLYPQGFRDPEEIRRIYLWSGYRGHKFVR